MQEIQLSPGSYCTSHADRIDKKMSLLSARSKTRECKKKRRERREGRNCKTKQLENREGEQYKTGLGYRKESLDQESEIEIPPPTCCSPPQVQKVPPTAGLKKVVIDLETSSRGTNNIDVNYLIQ